jgi:hypothetical protein
MHDNPSETTPFGLARFAHDYYDSARALESRDCKRVFSLVSPMPSLYLIGRSIELALKAYLLGNGLTLSKLRSKNFGHNLIACLKKANELGLESLVSFHPAERGALDLLNTLYASKQLEYIVTGEKFIPTFGLVESFAKKLIRVVAAEVGYSHFNRQ